MKLRLAGTEETFDAPRGIALALLALKESPVEAVAPPDQRANIGKQSLVWKLLWDLTGERVIGVAIKCETCGNFANVSNPSFDRASTRVLHACCGRVVTWKDCPANVDEEYRRTQKKKPAKPVNAEDERIRRAIATRVPMLPTESLNEFNGDTQYEGKR